METTATTTADLLPAAARFVTEVRELCGSGLPPARVWAQACDALGTLLADDDLREHARTWPDSLSQEGRPGNLLFYEDPDFGFVLNALIKAPGIRTSIHDHGDSWTLYGVLEGGERVTRFERTDGGAGVTDRAEVREVGAHEVVPGYIDFVPPWQIHQEVNSDRKTIGFIVRSKRSGTFAQNRFDIARGAVDQYDGPAQIPFRLAW